MNDGKPAAARFCSQRQAENRENGERGCRALTHRTHPNVTLYTPIRVRASRKGFDVMCPMRQMRQMRQMRCGIGKGLQNLDTLD